MLPASHLQVIAFDFIVPSNNGAIFFELAPARRLGAYGLLVAGKIFPTLTVGVL